MDDQQQTKFLDPRGVLSTYKDIWSGDYEFLLPEFDARASNLGYRV